MTRLDLPPGRTIGEIHTTCLGARFVWTGLGWVWDPRR